MCFFNFNYDELRDITNHAHPTVSVTSNQFAVEKKQAMPSIFLMQYSVSLGPRV